MPRLLSILLVCFIAVSSLSSMASATGEMLMLHSMPNASEITHGKVSSQQDCCAGPSWQDANHCGIGCNLCVVASHFAILNQRGKVIRQGASFRVAKPYHPNSVLERPPKTV